MSGSSGRCSLAVGLAAVLVVGAALPAHAAYSKLYKFPNNTGTDQTSVRAITQGLESIVYQWAYPSNWRPPTVGYTVLSGVFCTTITFGGPPYPPDWNVTIGWLTADGSCQVRDLRWGNGQSIVPTVLGGVPGSGQVFYDYPNPGDLTVVLSNENAEGCISLADVEFALSGSPLTLEQLSTLVGTSLAELRVAAIDQDIDVLRDEVAYYGELGTIKGPAAKGLIGKLDKAAGYKEDGLATYLAGDLDRALFLWGKSASQMDSFIKQVGDMSDSGNLSPDLYTRWIVDGGGEITTAPEIRDALAALPEGQALQSLSPLPSGTPLPPGLDATYYQPWPVTELCPGEFTAFVIPGVDEGAGIVLSGSVLDEGGDPVLQWIEQGVAEPGVPDTEPPVITAASATPAYLWPPDHAMIEMSLDVTVSDNVGAVWYVADVTSNQPQNGTGDGDYFPDWWVDPDNVQSLWLREERSGNDPAEVREYTITLQAIDMAGNLSAPYQLVVPVDHDQG